jgi:hypothetical protein
MKLRKCYRNQETGMTLTEGIRCEMTDHRFATCTAIQSIDSFDGLLDKAVPIPENNATKENRGHEN